MAIDRSAQKKTVLEQLSGGASIQAASEEAGIHRNTVHNWLRSDLDFLANFQAATQAQALETRTSLNNLVPDAIETMALILKGFIGTPAMRFRAALIVLKETTTPVKIEEPKDTRNAEDKRTDAILEYVQQRNAQIAEFTKPEEDTAQKVHNSAPEESETVVTIRREDPKIGRNAPCPCNSGRKYKLCCLNKPLALAA